MGCSSTHTQPSTLVEIAPDTFVELPQPSDLGNPLTASQLIIVKWNQTTHQLPVQLEVSDDTVKLAGFSSWGTRILSLEYNEDNIETEALSGLGTSLPDPKQILFYLMMTLWPKEVWQNKLDKIGWELLDSSQQRTLINDQGKKVVIIQYTNNDKLAGNIYMDNKIAHYQLIIQTLSNSNSSN